MCAGPVHAGSADRQHRVRCPSCLQIVVLKPMAPLAAVADPVPVQAGRNVPASIQSPLQVAEGPLRKEKKSQAQRIEELEARLRVLEQAVADLRASEPASKSRFEWMPKTTISDLSHERAEVLCHNLRTVTAHQIIIEFPTGDDAAKERATWFKEVFERADWRVGGPRDLETPALPTSLYLATALPVSPEVASMFIALRAAGFDLESAFDPEIRGGEERLFVG